MKGNMKVFILVATLALSMAIHDNHVMANDAHTKPIIQMYGSGEGGPANDDVPSPPPDLSANQHWHFGDDYLIIDDNSSGELVLDVARTEFPQIIALWTLNGGANQKWHQMRQLSLP
ncbi:unnamed protein product [Dovyalis caffra]|uniref:Ricin B lectin domain-containing protein n=1 Tax=Dovyalis caffra TaxID=77055 RepID=A0AAV1S5R9_9ROSI|nr:unnamed protein product [Dovyalis caffra]